MTRSELRSEFEVLLKGIAPVIREYVSTALAPLERELTELKSELAIKAHARGLTYRGVWQDGHTYVLGDVVTRGGSLWHCNTSTTSVIPGGSDTQSAWTLAVKKGADAKDVGKELQAKVDGLDRRVRRIEEQR